MLRIGILGGTFDPPHLGHVRLALSAVEDGPIDRLLIIPAARSPLKDRSPMLDGSTRADLLERLFRPIPQIAVELLEVRRGPPSYTGETLAALEARHPGAEFSLVLGADALATLPEWHRVPDWLPRIGLLVAPRAGVAPALPAGLPSPRSFARLPLDEFPVSASEVRNRWEAGRSLLGLVPETVLEVLLLRRQASRPPPPR